MRLFGHPLHPFLVHFPIAFWVAGAFCDGLAALGLADTWRFAHLLIVAGTTCAVPAMIAGFADLSRLRSCALSTANRHALLMSASWIIYLMAVITRVDQWTLLREPELLPVSLSFAGMITMAVGGRYGAHLVYHHGAGVRSLSIKQ